MRYITARPAQMLEAMIVAAVRETLIFITFFKIFLSTLIVILSIVINFSLLVFR